MKPEQVDNMTPRNRFVYWIAERYRIGRRKKSWPKPWTDDEILMDYFFTNPYREHDKTTQWFRRAIRDPLRNSTDVVIATIIFRWFNLIETGRHLNGIGLLTDWRHDHALKLLSDRRAAGHKIFTGAFMINSPGGIGKLEAICARIEKVWQDWDDLSLRSAQWRTLQEAHKDLTRYEGLGGFMAYEVVCDLRYTSVLKEATDIMTWCNPGPGCIRGLYRIAGIEIPNKSNATSPPILPGWQDTMEELLKLLSRKLPKLPAFEMREVEHSLCEFDKYERLRLKEGKSKRKYQGRPK